MRERRCKHCGELESGHHAFEAKQVPTGCVCDEESWYMIDDIPKVCETFIPDVGVRSSYCKTCEHEAGCHKEAR